MKAANRGHTDIRLRVRGTKKVHIFAGERVQMDKPRGAPEWMPEKIWKPKVKKSEWKIWNRPKPPVEKVVVVTKPGNDRHNLRQRSDPNDLSISFFYRPLLKFDIWAKKKKNEICSEITSVEA